MEGIIYVLSPLPEEWEGQYIDPKWARDWWYDPHIAPDAKEDLALLIERRRRDIDREAGDALSIIEVFRYCPEERLTAKLLHDSGLRALMGRYGC